MPPYQYPQPTWKDKIKRMWNEHPIECVVIGTLAITAVAKLIDSVSAARSRSAYARGVDYRVSSRR